MIYPAKIQTDGAGFMVSFRDIPEALTGAAARDEAIELAADALATAMDFYFEDRRQVPMPSDVRRGEVGISLPPSLSAKVLLLNEMLRQRVTPAELARRLETTPQVVTRIVDLRHATKIDTLAAAFHAIGRHLDVSVS